MRESYQLLKQIGLFDGISENDLHEVLKSMNATVRRFTKGDIVMHEGDILENIGIILSGSLQISRTDYAGNRLIIGQLKFPSMFAEALTFSGIETSPVSLIALKDTKILLIDLASFISSSQSIETSGIVTTNMLKILAQKNLFLQQRLDLLSKRSIRSKLSAYLLSAVERHGSNDFDIPFNRFALSDYLCINRSAMSRELCRMRDEDILEFNKSHFTIKDLANLSFYANQPSYSPEK